ncbi:MAG: hypothetical protein R3A47_11720 [Polyangiales bacterium]
MKTIAYSIFATALLFGSVASAQDQLMDPRVHAIFRLGAGGTFEASSGGVVGRVDADPTVGLTVRYEKPVHRFVTVGGLFSLLVAT